MDAASQDSIAKHKGRQKMTRTSTAFCLAVVLNSFGTSLACADDFPNRPEVALASQPLVDVLSPSGMSALVDRALTNSPVVQQALAEVQKAKGLRYQSTRSPNPVAGYSASEIGNEGRGGQQGVFWSQTFRRREKLDLNDQIGSWDVQAATWQWQAEQKRIAGNVQIRWYTAAAAAKQVELLNQLQEVLEAAVRTTKQLLDAGESSRTPYLQAQLELRRNVLQIRNAESSLEAARKQLAAVAAVSVFELPMQFDGLNDSLGNLDQDSYTTDLLVNSPELHLARARISQHQSNVCRQQVEPKTDLQTQFSVQYDDSTQDTVSGIQIGLTLPLFDRNKGNISAASADYIRATEEVRRKELELTRKAAAVYRDFIVANREVETIDAELMPLAKENLKMASQSFRAGETDYQSLLTAQRSYVELIVSRIDALRRVRQAEAVLNASLLADAGT